MKIEAKHIEAIVKRVLSEAQTSNNSKPSGYGMFDKMDDAIEAAYIAQKELMKLSLAKRGEIIEAIRKDCRENVELLAKMGHEESGMGRYEDKILKNLLVINKTPGIEDLECDAVAGDDGLTLYEYAPFGVIGSITPVTNPSETIINNSIGMIAAGNAVVFSPHPGATKTSRKTIEIINNAIMSVGGPENLITSVIKPSLENTQIMMKHEKIDMLVATGGPGVVNAVMTSGKKAIGAGAGNPPALVDETADIEKAAKDIIAGHSFDNNLPCTAEKAVVVVEQVADYLIFNMKKHNVYVMEDPELIEKLKNLVITEKGGPNREFIGKNANYILKHLGLEFGDDLRSIVVEVDKDHPFVLVEKMMPILPVVRVKDVDEGIELAVKIEGGNRHTATMHSKNVDNLTRFAREVQTTIFVKNGPSFAGLGYGGEGYTSFTLAGPTGEGLTTARTFSRKRKCVLVGGFSIK